MKSTNILTASILALAGLAALVPTANAAIPPYADGNLILAYSAQGPTPHTGKTYLVDLGAISQFQTGGAFATDNLITINTSQQANFLTDLSTAGIPASGVYGFLATNGGAQVWVSRKETTAGTGSTPVNNQNLDAPIADMEQVFNTATAVNSSANPNGIITDTAATSNGYATFAFGSNSPTQFFEGNFGNPEGSLSNVLDLYQVGYGTGSASRLGAFDFDSTTGALRFSSDVGDFAPVPEPASSGVLAACMLGAAALGKRRRFSRAIEA